ncbi:MAG: MFS transporter, partial [Muribaculaceae bacterium]|nr:MFS transporter [Muribaculaceae bacterium]
VWGAYLTSMSNYLGSAGMGYLIAWFFAIQGLVCLVMPALVGIIADRYVPPHRLLAMCQLGAGVAMGCCWWMGFTAHEPSPLWFTLAFTISSMFFMPTVALSNSLIFKLLRRGGEDTVSTFPRIRIFGTIGFIVAMLFVNCAGIDDGRLVMSMSGTNRFQFQFWQFLVSAIISLVLCIYSLTLPDVGVNPHNNDESLYDRMGLKALSIFRSSQIVVFFIFSMLMGMCVKVTNGFSGPFITSFMADDGYAASFGAANATLLTSISQVAEAVCVLLVPFFMKRYGVKVVLTVSMLAWALRFGTYALGNPGDGLWLLIFSMIIYGVAFDFFNIAGAIYLEGATDKRFTASAQGLWMMLTNGVGASIGTVLAGYVIDYFCHWTPSPVNPKMSLLVGNWPAAWLVFTVFSLITAVAFVITFRAGRK